jgi:serine/threonine protein kinase/WD40 repeat protein
MRSEVPTDDSVFARLVDEVAEALETRKEIPWQHYESEWPQYVAELRSLAPALEAMAALRSSDQTVLGGDRDDHLAAQGTLGDFRLIKEIGRGGMGIVYEAEQISLGRCVALKVLPFAAMMEPRQLQRFKNEARTAATLMHPHIVAVHAIGSERGLHYFAMQYVEGRSLAELAAELRQAGRFVEISPRSTVNAKHGTSLSTSSLNSSANAAGAAYFRQVARLGIQAARALDYAHQCGVVHRDIKPSNLLLDNEGKLWVADFGLATTAREADLTMTGDLLGTLRYMSPEQIRGERAVVDHRTDVYSLGVTLYELLALRPAFPMSDRHDLLRAVVSHDPLPLRKVRGSIPKDLETIVSTAMQKEPANRYQTAEALAADLQRLLEDRPIRARPTRSWEAALKWARRYPAWAALFLVCLLCGTAVIGLQFQHGRELASALSQTELLRQAGLQREYELQLRLYSADLAEAKHLIELQEGELAHDLLMKYHHTPGAADYRGPEWDYLVRQTTSASPLWRQRLDNVEILRVAAAPDGTHLISVNAAGTARIWNPSDGKLMKEFEAHDGEGRALVYSPDGSRLYSGGQDREIRVFDTRTWKVLVSRAEAHPRSIYALALSQDGSTLISGARDDGGIRVWNANDLSMELEIECPLGVYGIGLSAEEQEILTAHKENQLSRWSRADGRLIERKHFTGESGIHALTTAPELSTAFAASGGGWIFRHSLNSKVQDAAALSTHSGMFSLSWSHKAHALLAGSSGGLISHFWFGDSSTRDVRVGWRRGHEREICGLAWMPDGQHFATASRDGSIAFWNSSVVPPDELRLVVTGHGKINSLALSANGAYIATAKSGTVSLLALTKARQNVPLKTANPVGHLRFAMGDSRLIGALRDNRIGIWDATSGQFVSKLDLPRGTLNGLAISPDGNTAAVAAKLPDGTGHFMFFDVTAPRWLAQEVACAIAPRRLYYAPDGSRLLVIREDGSSELVNLEPASSTPQRLKMGGEYGACAFHPDGQILAAASASYSQVHLVDVSLGRPMSQIILSDPRIAAVDMAWSPDGRLLAISTTAGHIELWHVETRRRLYNLNSELLGHRLNLLQFSADGQTLAASLDEPDEQGRSVVALFPLGNAATANW